MLLGMAGDTGFCTDVFDRRVSVEGGRCLQLHGTQNMEHKAAKHELQEDAKVAESGCEVLVHGIVLMMTARLFCGARSVCYQFTVREQSARRIFSLNRGLRDGLPMHRSYKPEQ